jgi:hypothetical protein
MELSGSNHLSVLGLVPCFPHCNDFATLWYWGFSKFEILAGLDLLVREVVTPTLWNMFCYGCAAVVH